MQYYLRGEFQSIGEREFTSPRSARLKIRRMAGADYAPAIRFIFSFLIIILSCPLVGSSQWHPVLHSIGNFETIYFLDLPGPPRIGFASVDDSIYRTEDGGKTWQGLYIAHTAGEYDVAIDFAFKDSLAGWFAASGSIVTGNGGCYKTTDGGKSWTHLNSAAFAGTGIYYDSTDGGLFLSTWDDMTSSGNTFTSWDDGLTWIDIPGSRGNGGWNGFAFNDGLNGIVSSGYDGIPWLRTSDGGVTWNTIGMNSEIWQPLAIPGTTTQFAITDASGTVLRSDDIWKTWKVLYQFSIPGADLYWNSGMIAGNSCRLFVLLANGCYMSTDQGESWTILPGLPLSDFGSFNSGGFVADHRFYYKNNRIFVSTFDWTNRGVLWELDLDAGISERFDDGTQQTTLHPGDSIGVTFVPGAGTLAATDSVELTLRYDPNALSAPTLTVPAGWWVADSSTTCTTPQPPPLSEEGECVLQLTLRADSAEPLPDPLLHAEFKTYLTPSESRAGSPTYATFIYLDSAQSFFPQTTPCAPTTLSLQTPGSVEIDFTGCGDSTILAAMEGQPPFSIVSIVPNPARTSFDINVSNPALAPIAYTLFDALGNEVFAAMGTGRAQHVPTDGLPSGTYFLRLSENGYVQTREVSIER